MSEGSQKFIARNRAPRVQIEYDVELYGSEKKVQLPFVMGVMSDLAGKSHLAQPAVADRRFLEIDADNFDDRMQAMAPRVAFAVPNTLTGEGNLAVDLTFAKMDDFSPAAIAAQVAALRPLLEARTQLANLMAYMDGKSGAESLIEQILADPGILAALSGDGEAGNAEQAEALASLRGATPAEEAKADDSDATLAALRATAPVDTPDEDTSAGVLGRLATRQPVGPDNTDTTASALDSLAGVEVPDAPQDDMDALLADISANAPMDDPDDVPGDPDAQTPEPGLDNLDGLLAGPDSTESGPKTPPAEAGAGAEPAGKPARMADADLSFGTMAGARPDPRRLSRTRFRMAILGDFSGRAARGVVETGDALAARRAILLDPDTVEEVIAGFATDLVLPIGKDGAGMVIPLRELDDLHPDELYDNVELFSELVSLRRQLASGATAANAADKLRAWGEAHGTPLTPPRLRSSGNAVPADRRLSDFQQLIGDTGGRLSETSPLDDLLARIVGPHIRAVPGADVQAMQWAVDEALTSAMRLVLHHPEFQSLEAQWRTIDLIARSVETDDSLDVMLYDISAGELAADLAQADDLAQSGLARLLTDEPLDPENGRGGYSALIGLYSFEETPPHAELLGRIAQVAAHVDAPFIASLSTGFMDIAKPDRHPLVARAWDRLREMREAVYLGLATPRFLLRRPYGAKSEPCYAFDFEEFTMAEGLKGMLWANPAVLVAILLARSFRQHGAAMNLGSVMSLGGMPYHFVTDRYGDQVALPCTERNLTLDKVEAAMARGVMPVVSIKGRDEIRLASFQSLGRAEIRGPWSGAAPPPPRAPVDAVADGDEAGGGDDLDDLLAGLGDVGGDEAGENTGEGDVDLDDLLASFDDASDDSAASPDDDGDIDADLAALLEDL